MATSGSYSFTLNKLQFLTRVLQSINAIDLNDTPDSNDLSFASDMLNMMIKMWEIDGIHLFKRFEATLFPQTGQYIYQIGNTSGVPDHCSLTANYVKTTVAAAVLQSATSVVVMATTGMTVGQQIGLELDSNIRQWGTILTINAMTNTIGLSFATTTTSQTMNTVVVYTKNINRPLEILRGTSIDLKANFSEITMQALSYDEYFDMPVKNTPGIPNNFYYDRILNNGIPYSGTLYLYNAPYKVSQLVNFTYTDSIQDMLNSADNFDLPQEWMLPLLSGLAALLAQYGYGKQVELQSLQATAAQHYAILKNFDTDTESLQIMPDHANYPNTLL